MEPSYLSVSQLSNYIKEKFVRDPYLRKVYLKGEISNSYRNRPYTTQYFKVKDDQAVMNAVMFSNEAKNLTFDLEDGINVQLTGYVSTYGLRSEYQIIVQTIELAGKGNLYQAFEQLKKVLNDEGLFESTHKQLLPLYPQRIAVITSKSGAVIQDIISTIQRRCPSVEIVLYETYVQGAQAAGSIVKNIKRADEVGTFDVIIVGRGGGSIEDLWAFNEEQVVRAIFEAQTPIISSVGHETDTTLADFAADKRAATPTAAAELCVPSRVELEDKINSYEHRLTQYITKKIHYFRERINQLDESYIFKQPTRLYEMHIQRIDRSVQQIEQCLKSRLKDDIACLKHLVYRLANSSPKQLVIRYQHQIEALEQQLTKHMEVTLFQKKKRIDYLIESLDHLSPLRTLSRGYSYTTTNDRGIKSTKDVTVGDDIYVYVPDGHIKATVVDKQIKGVEEHGTNQSDI